MLVAYSNEKETAIGDTKSEKFELEEQCVT